MQQATIESVANAKKAARSYPSNSLKEPVRKMEYNLFNLAKKTFAK